MIEPESKKAIIEHEPIYGREGFWKVLGYRVGKLIAVDLPSRAFLLMVLSMAFAGGICGHQLVITKQSMSWMEMLVVLFPFLTTGLYWVERSVGGELIKALADRFRTGPGK